MSIRRQKRVADLIHRELSDIIQRRVKDPRLVGVTITGTRVSPDYQYADVRFYRLGGDPEALKEAKQGLESAQGFIRRELAGRLTIRHTPELRFHLDESIDYAAHIESLLTQIRQETVSRDEDGAGSSETDL
ncbi:MAG: 30S ribosome-binding factor RbfA [Anaerolineae bacterium]|nr:30S ribosome-binding factor RbfA [Anaerolineae bacterium]